MSKYSVEELKSSAITIRSMRWHADEGEEMMRVADMLEAYAERIKADEGVVPVGCEVVGVVRENDDGKYISWTVEGSLDALETGDALYCIDGIDAPDDGFAELFTHPPAQAAQVDEKVVVIRDGQATTEGLVLAAAIYMGAVKDIFALRSDGPPYNERNVTKDVAALRAFDHLDAATKALRSAISHFAPTAEPVAQGEAVAPNGYHYVYPNIWGAGEVIRKNDGREVDGIKPLRAIPYWYTSPAQPRAVPENCLPFTNEVIDKMQDVMADHGFTVPVRVISDAFRTTRVALLAAAPSQGESA